MYQHLDNLRRCCDIIKIKSELHAGMYAHKAGICKQFNDIIMYTKVSRTMSFYFDCTYSSGGRVNVTITQSAFFFSVRNK